MVDRPGGEASTAQRRPAGGQACPDGARVLPGTSCRDPSHRKVGWTTKVSCLQPAADRPACGRPQNRLCRALVSARYTTETRPAPQCGPLTDAEAAAHVSCSPRTIRRHRASGTTPTVDRRRGRDGKAYPAHRGNDPLQVALGRAYRATQAALQIFHETAPHLAVTCRHADVAGNLATVAGELNGHIAAYREAAL